MNKYSGSVLAALLSASLPMPAAIAASAPVEDAATLTPKSVVDTALVPGVSSLISEADAAPSLRKSSPVAIGFDAAGEASAATTLAGLPFTDFERERSIHNTGGTTEPWLSPEANPVEAEPHAETDAPPVEPPLEWRDISGFSQTPTVDGLSDVSPDDWAFTAVQTLVEEYGCLSGFPDGTFRGDRPMTRFEFAAAFSACFDRIVEVLPEDQETIQLIQSRFQQELSDRETLSARVDDLEAQVEELRANQFSSTTRLFGQVIFGVQARSENDADFFPVDGIAETEDPGGGSTTFYSNAQLFLLSRLSRRDLLFVGLQAGEGNSLFNNQANAASGLTNNIRLAYEADTDFNIQLSDLTYRRLIGDSLALVIGARGVNPVSVFRGPSEAEGAGSGPLSLFAQRNPILSIGSGDTGIGFDWQIFDRLSLQGVYATSNASDATDGGLFRGDRTLGFQLTASPFDAVNLALNYINDYSETGNLGTGIGDSQLTTGDAITTNAFGGTITWDITPRFTLGGWGGYTTSVTPGEIGSVDTFNWMAFLNFPDLFGPGNLGGIYVGQPPRITGSTLRQGQNIPDLLAGGFGDPGDQPGTTTHVEVFYRYQLTENISLTPGFIAIFNPANTPDSDDIYIGALRTTFRF